jgi:cytochrome b561
MALRNEPGRYGSVARSLHWVMAALLITTLIIMEARGYTERGSDLRRSLGDAHYQIGVGIFILVWIRLAWRLRETEPAISPPLPRWQRTASHAVAWAFYALMIALPILGTLSREAGGNAVTFLGATLPTFVGADRATARTLVGVHKVLGNVMIALVLLHVAAAFYHAFIRRDDVFARMIGAR